MRMLPIRRVRRWLAWPATEWLLLSGILVAAAGGFAFAWLAGEVIEGETERFDRRLLLAFRSPADPSDPIGPRWVEEMARDVTALGSGIVLAFMTLGVIGYLLLARKRGAALLVALAVGGGTLLSTLLKFGFDRPRPDLVPHAVAVYTASFPSGHAMLSAATFLTLGALLMRVATQRRLKFYVMALAVLATVAVGLSRVYLGVHWPTDVLAGWSAGAAWALLCWLVALRLQQAGRVETPPVE
jgi:undecaprenyl-diphosphatase